MVRSGKRDWHNQEKHGRLWEPPIWWAERRGKCVLDSEWRQQYLRAGWLRMETQPRMPRAFSSFVGFFKVASVTRKMKHTVSWAKLTTPGFYRHHDGARWQRTVSLLRSMGIFFLQWPIEKISESPYYPFTIKVCYSIALSVYTSTHVFVGCVFSFDQCETQKLIQISHTRPLKRIW